MLSKVKCAECRRTMIKQTPAHKICNVCHKKRTETCRKRWRERNTLRIRQIAREWRERNRERLRTYNREYKRHWRKNRKSLADHVREALEGAD